MPGLGTVLAFYRCGHYVELDKIDVAKSREFSITFFFLHSCPGQCCPCAITPALINNFQKINDVVGYFFQMDIKDGKIRFSSGTTKQQFYYYSAKISSGWHHVAVTLNAEYRKVQIYIDGKIQEVTKGHGNWYGVHSNPTFLGSWKYGDYFLGAMSELMFFKTILSEKQIQILSRNKTPSKLPNLLSVQNIFVTKLCTIL